MWEKLEIFHVVSIFPENRLKDKGSIVCSMAGCTLPSSNGNGRIFILLSDCFSICFKSSKRSALFFSENLAFNDKTRLSFSIIFLNGA